MNHHCKLKIQRSLMSQSVSIDKDKFQVIVQSSQVWFFFMAEAGYLGALVSISAKHEIHILLNCCYPVANDFYKMFGHNFLVSLVQYI